MPLTILKIPPDIDGLVKKWPGSKPPGWMGRFTNWLRRQRERKAVKIIWRLLAGGAVAALLFSGSSSAQHWTESDVMEAAQFHSTASSDPYTCSSYHKRRSYFNTTTNKYMVCNGTAWVSLLDSAGVALVDDIQLVFGTGSDAAVEWDTAETVDALKIGLDAGATGSMFHIMEKDDLAYDRTMTAQATPSLVLWGAAQATNNWLRLTHNGTNGQIRTGVGAINLLAFSSTYYLGAVTSATPAAQYIQASNGVGTDIAGGGLYLRPGYGTGAGDPGDVFFQTSATLGTGATAQTFATVFRINEEGPQWVDRGSKPACAAGLRGTAWYDAGAGGVADTFEVCAKSSGDVYAWYALATVP